MGDTKIMTYVPGQMMQLGTMNDNMYSNGETIAMHTFMKNNDIIFDVGANVGKWSAYVFSIIIPKMIFAFEPVGSNFEQLYKRFHYRENIKMYNNAVMHENCKAKFINYKNNGEMSNLFGRPEIEKQQGLQREEIEVIGVRLDDFIRKEVIPHIDFLKIDSEGAEYLVLQGLAETLSKNMISVIQWEFGGCHIDSKTKIKDIFSLLSKYGYSNYRLFNEGLIYLDRWYDELDNYNHANYLAISDNKAKEVMGGFVVHPMEGL